MWRTRSVSFRLVMATTLLYIVLNSWPCIESSSTEPPFVPTSWSKNIYLNNVPLKTHQRPGTFLSKLCIFHKPTSNLKSFTKKESLPLMLGSYQSRSFQKPLLHKVDVSVVLESLFDKEVENYHTKLICLCFLRI